MTNPASLAAEPCPFCRRRELKAHIFPNSGGNIHYIGCGSCNARGPWGNSVKQAFALLRAASGHAPAQTQEDALLAAVELAATTFESYAKLHFDKDTASGDEKGRANNKLAQHMRSALAARTGPPAAPSEEERLRSNEELVGEWLGLPAAPVCPRPPEEQPCADFEALRTTNPYEWAERRQEQLSAEWDELRKRIDGFKLQQEDLKREIKKLAAFTQEKEEP